MSNNALLFKFFFFFDTLSILFKAFMNKCYLLPSPTFATHFIPTFVILGMSPMISHTMMSGTTSQVFASRPTTTFVSG